MGRTILVTAVFLLAIVGIAQAQDSELHGSVDLTYQSKYIWRGFDVYNDKSAVQPSLDLDLRHGPWSQHHGPQGQFERI